MEVVDGRPPNYALIVAAFPGAAMPGVMFAYEGRIYAPGRRAVSPALQAHEQVHLERQGKASDLWWHQYIRDVEFRLEEELVAHRAEFRAFCERHRNSRKQEFALTTIAQKLSSPLYGGIITLEEARRRISTP